MKKLAALTLSLFLSLGTALADSPKDAPKDTPKEADAQPAKTTPAAKPATTKSNAEIAAEMEELRQTLQAQQEQLEMLKEELAKRDKQIEEARETAASANSRATEANVKATEAVATSAEVKGATSTLNTTVANMAASQPAVSNAALSTAGGQGGAEEKGPLTIRYKGVNITPGGFLAAETVNRQRAESADINSNFNGIPFSGNSTGRLAEMNLTGRQSRLTLLVDGKVGIAKLSGYYEADFLGTGVTSNNRESNSYVFRQRQVWARADLESGWAFTGGQMWTLATENRKGMANRTEALPMVIDPQYNVGFTWERAYGFRVTKNFGDHTAVGFSIEGPQATVGGRGFDTYTNTSATGVVTTFQSSFVFSPGAGAGLFNFVDTTGYSVNKTPDFVLKAAFDPGWGHYEILGIVSTFQNRVYPCAVVGTTAKNFPTPVTPTVLPCPVDGTTAPSATGAFNDSVTGGGVGGSLNVPVLHKKLDAGVKLVWGDGIGRFGAAQLSDATLKPGGYLSLIHGGQFLGRLEWHVTPKIDVYGYLGGEYAARTAYLGYTSVKITNTPAIPGCGAVGQQKCPGGGIQPSYPALVSTAITTNGFGGYGSRYANNSGCSTELPPGGTGAPSAGGTCAGDTRYISEATIGFWHRIYTGEYGRLQWGIQYSYFYKNTWSGTDAGGLTGKTSIQPHAVDNMVWTSFRYYLP